MCDCAQRNFPTVMGTAERCGHKTTRGNQTYCTKCAVLNNACPACGESRAKKPPEPTDTTCSECGPMANLAMGTGSECGHECSSRGHKWCPACAKKRGVCQTCGKAMGKPKKKSKRKR